MTRLTIGRLAERAGVATSAVRFYEARGLVRSRRTTGNQRRFAQSELRPDRLHQDRPARGLAWDGDRGGVVDPTGDRVPTKADWTRLSKAWRPRLDDRIERIERLRDQPRRPAHRLRLPEPADVLAPRTPATRSLSAAPARCSWNRSNLHEWPCRIVANRPDPAIVSLAWCSSRSEEWTDQHVVPLPRGLSRHVVRRCASAPGSTRSGTDQPMAFRESRLLRDLQRLGLPAVVPQGVVTGRVDAGGEALPTALLTQHLRFSLPYRSLFSHGLTADNLPSPHRRACRAAVRSSTSPASSGATAPCPTRCSVAARASSRRTSSTPRRVSCTTSCPTVSGSTTTRRGQLLRRDARPARRRVPRRRGRGPRDHRPDRERYEALWSELTGVEDFTTDEMWRIENASRASTTSASTSTSSTS